jgi:hypothetical protein
MQPIEEFMQELFLTRIAEEKRVLASRVPYRREFFSSECAWDSRAGSLEMIETERIVSVEKIDLGATVITEYNIPAYASGVETHRRRRYHLKAVNKNWLIWLVEEECPMCHGHGDENCLFCKGKHWGVN